MSDIYRVINPETGQDQLLVSKEYVDLRIAALKEALSTHIQNIDNAHTDKSDRTIKNAALLDNGEITNLVIKEANQDIPAENINTDPSHRFVTQSQLEVFKSKPSSLEVETLISNAYNDMKNRFNEMYANLLNNKDAVQKLKEVSKLITEEGPESTLVSALSQKVDVDEFKEHTESVFHLTNADRKALNILLGLIKDGTFDKVSAMSLDTSNFSMNSAELDGKTYDQVRAKGKYKKIYSVYGYNENMADHYFSAGCYIHSEVANEFITNMEGAVLFLPTSYNVPEFSFLRSNSYNDLTIEGCGNGTLFKIDRMQCNNVAFEDCRITGGTITLDNNTTFSNIQFDNCIITLKDRSNCRFMDCVFNDCRIIMQGVCRYNRIKDCLFNRTKVPKYIGGNNVISGSIETI